LLGITADKVETTLGWIKHLCLGDTSFWFPILSDVSPHGAVAKKYGVLRSDGYSERALFLIDKKGIIRYIDVHEQDSMPPFTVLVEELEKLKDS
jgi:peroxiredoxin (alkyl hydroperoxide reductase subunit C)